MLIAYLEKQREKLSLLVIVPVQWTFQNLAICDSLQFGFSMSYSAFLRHPTAPSWKATTQGQSFTTPCNPCLQTSLLLHFSTSFLYPRCSVLNLTHCWCETKYLPCDNNIWMHPASSPKHWCYSNFLKRCQHNYLWQILRIMLQPQLIWNRNDKRDIPYPDGIYKRKIRETFEQSVVWVSLNCDICHPTGHQGWFSTSDCKEDVPILPPFPTSISSRAACSFK